MSNKLVNAYQAFDAYNKKDPNTEVFEGNTYSKELLYAIRMTEQLEKFAPGSPEHVQLAARCQHIGRWEIARAEYPMDKKGYLQWRNKLKQHHASIAEKILKECGYDTDTIEKVKFLLLKKQLHTNAETQLLEDIICLVFVEYYLDDFAAKHDEEKVIDILHKTLKKMSNRAITQAVDLVQSDHVKDLLQKATSA